MAREQRQSGAARDTLEKQAQETERVWRQTQSELQERLESAEQQQRESQKSQESKCLEILSLQEEKEVLGEKVRVLTGQ